MPTNDSSPTAAITLAPAGDYDAENIGPLATELSEATARCPVVVLDLSGVTFADSTFLNLLLRAHQETDLRLADLATGVARLLSVTGADSVLNTYSTVSQAEAQAPRKDTTSF